MKRNLYADTRALDGGLSTGWRRVKKGGRIKFAGTWFYAPELDGIKGTLVSVSMGEYWESFIVVQRGVIGCLGWLCRAYPKRDERGGD